MYVWCKQAKKRINCFISLEWGEFAIFHCDGEHMMMMICVKNKTNEALNGNSCWLIDTSMCTCTYMCIFVVRHAVNASDRNGIFCRFDISSKNDEDERKKTNTNTSRMGEKTLTTSFNIIYNSDVKCLFHFLQWTISPCFVCPFFIQKLCDDAIKTSETKEWQAAHLLMCVHYIMQVKWTNCLFAHNILFRYGKEEREIEKKKQASQRLYENIITNIMCVHVLYHTHTRAYALKHEKRFELLVERRTIKNLSDEKCVTRQSSLL